MAADSLKMSLGEIRSLIDVQKEEWIHMDTTNCYAYALGLDIAESDIIPYAYVPGIISHSDIDLTRLSSFSYESLLKNIYLDFEALEIDFREISPLDEVGDDEWKIALFTRKCFDLLDDYHFLRCHNDGIWYHKNGYLVEFLM